MTISARNAAEPQYDKSRELLQIWRLFQVALNGNCGLGRSGVQSGNKIKTVEWKRRSEVPISSPAMTCWIHTQNMTLYW